MNFREAKRNGNTSIVRGKEERVVMTQTVQPCSGALLSKADNDLSVGKGLTKSEAEKKLKFLLSVYDIMSQFSENLDKLDCEIKKTCIELSNYYEKVK